MNTRSKHAITHNGSENNKHKQQIRRWLKLYYVASSYRIETPYASMSVCLSVTRLYLEN